MKNILIIYSKMIIGGSTTSLLSLLKALRNYKDINIDLLLFEGGGELFSEIPSYVNVLVLLDSPEKEAAFQNKKKHSMRYIFSYLNGSFLSRNKSNKLIRDQLTGLVYPDFLPRIEKCYDVSISYLEFGVLAYNANYIKANKKIAWIHVDYLDTELLKNVESRVFEKIDRLVMVSEKCVSSFSKLYPKFSNKTVCIENIFLADSIRDKNVNDGSANLQWLQKIKSEKKYFTLLSVSRIVFSHKGHDRVIRALVELRKKYDISRLIWVVVGDGPDFSELEKRVNENHLEKNVFLLGPKDNAIPYMANADVLIMASRYEGKPMVISEAHIMGIPVVATDFSSAREAIQDDFDGKVFPNTDDGMVEALEWVYSNQTQLLEMKYNILKRDYSNLYEIDKLVNEIYERGNS